MQVAFDAKRRAMALTEGHGQVERIPDYRVQTPLQSAVQILKRHRDGLFADRPDTKPASIIVSTLAAHAYGSEGTIAGALLSILSRLDAYIDYSTGHPRILNPTDERENFADRWIREPSFKEAFDEWLTAAREDFRSASLIATEDEIADRLADRLGGALVERIAASSASTQRANRIGKALQLILGASHRKEPAWPVVRDGHVQITNVTVARRGFRVSRLGSNAPALAKGCDLKFQADTNVSWPYEVYWQIVNTGRDAAAANDLRGSFENASSERGQLVKKETARYGGTHSIECFIVKNGYCVARSGPFLVNVKA